MLLAILEVSLLTIFDHKSIYIFYFNALCFQSSRDTATATYITSILREVLCLKQGKGKKCSGNYLMQQNNKDDLCKSAMPSR